MVKIEDITDEIVDKFRLSMIIADVYIYYDSSDDSIKCSFSVKPNGFIIFTYTTSEHLMLSELELKSLIKISIINFLLPYHRSGRIDSLLD